jgi:hypothetical protein
VDVLWGTKRGARLLASQVMLPVLDGYSGIVADCYRDMALIAALAAGVRRPLSPCDQVIRNHSSVIATYLRCFIDDDKQYALIRPHS